MEITTNEEATPYISRRDFLRIGSLGIGAAALSRLLEVEARGQAKEAKARSVIQIWMNGGATHLDTFDPKPEAGEAWCGPLKHPIQTKAAGMRISELLPLLAQQADKFSILRSVTHGSDAHEIGTYLMQTGTPPTNDLVYPAMGSVVALKKGYGAGYKGLLPPFITLTSPLGRFSGSGFLGPDYRSFETGGDPAAAEFRVDGIVPPGAMTAQRLQDRQALLQSIDGLAAGADSRSPVRDMDGFQRKAYEMIAGEASKVFDLKQEKDEVRNRYGRNWFGQSCLCARRLVENGVPFITVNWGGWDMHTDIFGALKTMLPMLDAGFAALLDDLAQRGLLQTTIVVWCTEFGRTPRISYEAPWNGGRHHYGTVFSAVVAGGGFRGGAVVGATDDKGEHVKERPVYPWDLSASIYRLLGIDPLGRLPHPQGCVAYVTPLATGAVPSGGPLNEIM
jgi:hypothetical protein